MAKKSLIARQKRPKIFNKKDNIRYVETNAFHVNMAYAAYFCEITLETRFVKASYD